MNSYLARLFNQQSTILHNYVLMKLVTFFMNPTQTSIFLYETVVITKDVTKKEMIRMEKKPPNTQKYSVYAEKVDGKLIFTLRLDGFSTIEFYNVVLNNEQPTVHALKTIVAVIVSRCRPMPTKVDNKFSILATKYSDYLDYYQVKRSWQNGYFAKYTRFKKQTAPKKLINSIYEDFLCEVSSIQNTYRAFSKILIDTYQGKNKVRYTSDNRIFILDVGYTKEFGISLELDDSREQHFSHEVIHLEDFTPGAPFFKDKYEFVKGVTAAVYPLFNNKK